MAKNRKKIFLYPATRRRIVVDESRFFNMTNNFTYGEKKNLWQKRLSLIDGYLWNPRNFGTQDTFDFNTLTRDQRKDFMYRFFGASHINIDAQKKQKRF